MKVLSLFSGVGGFDLGLENAGMETVFQCEWDKHATAILERHWPNVPRWGDITTLTGRHILNHAPVIDVVAWGSPCQDLSVAGKRAGLGGTRSGLFHEGIRIIKELKELTNDQYPRISIWENVYGALSSNGGADFGQVLNEMDEAGACFSEWRVLDAQYFGVPQRRRRVFLISVFDPGIAAKCPDPLLPVSEGVRWNPSTGRTTRQTTTRSAEESIGGGSFGGWNEADTAITLSARDHKSSNTIIAEPFTGTSHAQYGAGVGTLRANGGDLAGGSETLLVEPFVKAKRAQSATDDETWVEGDINPTINQFDQGDVRATTVVVGSLQARDHKGTNHEGARDGKLIVESTTVIAFASNQRSEVRDLNDKAVALSAEPGTNQQTFVATAIVMRQQEGKPGGGKGPLLSEDKSLTLAVGSNDQTLFVATEPMLIDGRRIDDVRVYDPPVQTLQERMGTGGNNVPVIGFSHTQGLSAQPSEAAWPTLRTEGNGMAVAFTTEQTPKWNDNQALTLTGGSPSGGGQPQAVATTMSVRRLTPLECERLMGWPDDWTAGQADTHRYKQCGNGVASPVAQWIAEQILNTTQ